MLQVRPELLVICEAADGSEAVRKAEELKPDLILLDIGLPKLNGIEAARQIRELVPESKILVLSQESLAIVAQEVLRLGVSGYVVKSHAGRELLPAIEAVLQGRQFVSAGLEDCDSLREEAKSNLSFHFEFDAENKIVQAKFHGPVTDESIKDFYQTRNLNGCCYRFPRQYRRFLWRHIVSRDKGCNPRISGIAPGGSYDFAPSRHRGPEYSYFWFGATVSDDRKSNATQYPHCPEFTSGFCFARSRHAQLPSDEPQIPNLTPTNESSGMRRNRNAARQRE